MSTEYHAKFFAHKLNIAASGSGRLDRALFDATVDLNPHQIEAALFAIKSPLSRGVILADEVGLGKTIEAGLVLSQHWAERQRKILIICPASLCRQWQYELEEKFNLPVQFIESKFFYKRRSQGFVNPMDCDKVIICSIDFSAKNGESIRGIPWDLVVIDEAHRLRNVYRNDRGKAAKIRKAIAGSVKKILLTATPLQNSLEDLYGLSTFIDETLFGGVESFRDQYVKKRGKSEELKERLAKFCKRTLRKDVQEFIKFTKRSPLTVKYTASDTEHKLYEKVSALLQRENSYALPNRQRHFLMLLLHKLLGSSTYALIGTLEALSERLRSLRNSTISEKEAGERLVDIEGIDEDLSIEMAEDQEESDSELQDVFCENQVEEKIDLKKVEEEIKELDQCIAMARSIGCDTKLLKLKEALTLGFLRMNELGAKRKAVIFTESRRTQSALRNFLESEGFCGKVINFSGTNSDAETSRIYEQWANKNRESGHITGVKQVDIRTALIESFKEEGEILIATEAGAEGINLQFCSLVINYDLPWNPQRVEQRIGRCHRYGQKHDVVVVNFLNIRNAADCRLLELLDEKIHLFSGLFGASDDVLGSIASGVDFGKRILDIYRSCRRTEEIERAFKDLVDEFRESIDQKMGKTRKLILENFDSDIHDKFKVNLEGTRERLDQMQKMLWRTTKFILRDCASFMEEGFTFILQHPPVASAPSATYHLHNKKEGLPSGSYQYRLNHPLGEFVLERARALPCGMKELVFNSSGHPVRIASVEALKGKWGWMMLQQLSINAYDSKEYLLFSAFDSSGRTLDSEACEKLFQCDGYTIDTSTPPEEDISRLHAEAERCRLATISKNREENQSFQRDKSEQFERWAEEQKGELERELKRIKAQRIEADRRRRTATTLEEQKQAGKEIQKIEREVKRKRREFEEREDEIDLKREEMLDRLEMEIQQKTTHQQLFAIRWRVV